MKIYSFEEWKTQNQLEDIYEICEYCDGKQIICEICDGSCYCSHCNHECDECDGLGTIKCKYCDDDNMINTLEEVYKQQLETDKKKLEKWTQRHLEIQNHQ